MIYDEDLFSLLSKQSYENIIDSLVKNWYDTMKIVLESNDITFIKKTMRKITKVYDSTQILNTAYSMLVKQNVNLAFNDLINKEELKKFPTTFIDGIPVYHIDNSMNFSFLAHIVTKQFLREHPEEWTNNKTLSSRPTLLSLTKINNWLHKLYGTSIESIQYNLCLLFEEVPHEQVYIIDDHDAGTFTGKFTQSNKNSLKAFEKSHVLSTRKDSIPDYHNEIAVQRRLPNGTRRMPFAILVNDSSILNNTSPAVIWAKYYNLPLVMYHVKEKNNDEIITETQVKK